MRKSQLRVCEWTAHSLLLSLLDPNVRLPWKLYITFRLNLPVHTRTHARSRGQAQTGAIYVHFHLSDKRKADNFSN